MVQNNATSTPETSSVRKRFHPVPGLHAPALLLDADASIQHLGDAARRMLEHSPTASIDACFFSHVHGKNLRQVMQDIADMVRYGKPQASWLLRLRTGQGRWRWYKARVTNELDAATEAIVVRLRGLYDW